MVTRSVTVIRQVSTYLEEAFGDLDHLTEVVKGLLQGVEYDTLVGTGLSGALVIPHLAHVLKKDFLIVRKEGDSQHASYRAEGRLGDRWVLLDDTVCSGDTLRRVQQAVLGVSTSTQYVGAALYHDRQFIPS